LVLVRFSGLAKMFEKIWWLSIKLVCQMWTIIALGAQLKHTLNIARELRDSAVLRLGLLG